MDDNEDPPRLLTIHNKDLIYEKAKGKGGSFNVKALYRDYDSALVFIFMAALGSATTRTQIPTSRWRPILFFDSAGNWIFNRKICSLEKMCKETRRVDRAKQAAEAQATAASAGNNNDRSSSTAKRGRDKTSKAAPSKKRK